MTDVLKQYQGDAITVSFTTNLFDALLDNEWTAASDEIANSANYPFADFEIVLGSAAFTGSDSAIELYIIPSVDGTNYADWNEAGNTTDAQENNQHFIGSVTTSGDTAAQRLTLRDVEVPAGKFKVGIRNRGGVTLNATNTCKLRYWAYKSA